MGGSEAVISAATRYLNALKMPCYCTEKQWNELQNKENFKSLCVKHGLPVAKRHDVTLDDTLSQRRQIDFPVITKPADGSGSSGFSVCNDFPQLKAGYEKAMKLSPTGSVIVEDFVKNDSVVVFYTFSNGDMFFSGIEDKYPVHYKDHGTYVAGMHVFESSRKNEFRARYEEKIRTMCQSLKLKEGSLWIEVFHDRDDYYFNEAGYRYSGSVTMYPVDYFYEINQVAADIFYSLAGKSRLKGFRSIFGEPILRKRRYCIYSVHLRPGRIAEIQGLDTVKGFDNVISIPTTMYVGDEVISTGTVGQVFGFVHFVFDTIDECIAIVDKVHETVKVIDTDGNNMVARLLNLSPTTFRHV